MERMSNVMEVGGGEESPLLRALREVYQQQRLPLQYPGRRLDFGLRPEQLSPEALLNIARFRARRT